MADFVGFVGDAYTAPSFTQDTQELINWFCEIDPRKMQRSPLGPAERGVMALYPTPGLIQKLALNVAPVRGLHTLSGGQILLAVVGSSFWSISANFTANLIGYLATTNGPVSIADNGYSAMIVDGTNRYYYNFVTSTPGGFSNNSAWTVSTAPTPTVPTGFGQLPITDGPFVGGTVVDVCDNYFVYSQPGSQFWGASSVLSVFSPQLSMGQKFGFSDNIVSLGVVGREVFLFGENTTEPWVDTGGFPFPFSIIPGTNTQHGCAAPLSVSRLGESFAFVSQDTRGQGIIVRMVGYNIKRISTHSVENDLLGQVIKDAIAYTYQMEGHEFYVVTFPTADKTWVFDLSTEMWHKWLSIDSNGVYHRHRSNCQAVFQGQVIVGDHQNGKLYALDNNTYTDNGATIRRVRRSPHLVKDYGRVVYNKLQVMFQPGVGLQTGQGSSPQAMMRWSDDGGFTWSNEHWQDIGEVGLYKNRAIWRQMGQARDRVYELVVTDPVKAVVVSADLDAIAGAY